MGIKQQDKIQRDEINRRIIQIGKVYGAQDSFFERAGTNHGNSRYHRRLLISDGGCGCFGVCLCCIPLSEQLVVLLNGERRTENELADCPNCSSHFQLAGRVSQAISCAECAGLIELRGNEIVANNNLILEL